MARGGARNRSGPPADPTSARSERRGFKLNALPATGYDGAPPEFPLPPAVAVFEYFVDKQKVRELDDGASEVRRDREQALWEWAWSTPQACAWSMEPWRWQAVAMWVRTSAICESPEATAADKNALHRFADQIGLTPAGLRENGWAIAPVESEPAAERDEQAEPEAPRQRRLRAVGDGGE